MIALDGKQRRIAALAINNPNKIIDIGGLRFGRLVAVERVVHKAGTWWKCRCDCGGESVSLSVSLRKGKAQSCGCLQRERTAGANATRIRHGHARHKKDEPSNPTRTYTTWKCMLDRCRCESSPNYSLYGGRGIKVCRQWQGKDGFSTFFADVGERPEGKTLDRIDSDGNYEPGNVRWATPTEQAANRRKKITASTSSCAQ